METSEFLRAVDWTVIEDTALIRLMAYMHCHSDYVLSSTLEPDDLANLILRLFTDADWNGDAATTRSTTGIWLAMDALPWRAYPLAEQRRIVGAGVGGGRLAAASKKTSPYH